MCKSTNRNKFNVPWSLGLGTSDQLCAGERGQLCLHTGLSIDSLKDSSVTGIPNPNPGS